MSNNKYFDYKIGYQFELVKIQYYFNFNVKNNLLHTLKYDNAKKSILF